MTWAETRRSLSGWLALAALALQLAVSFGHMHPEDFVHGRPGTVIATQGGSGAGEPGDNDHEHLDCAICATMDIAGTLLLPVPPVIALPAEIVVARLGPGERSAPQRARALAFNARAPPRA
jgi:hypothetical protein